jgi:DNA repair photolyase
MLSSMPNSRLARFETPLALFRRQSANSYVREFKFSLEPYAGCRFGCKYCFVPAKSNIARQYDIQEWGRWFHFVDRHSIDQEFESRRRELPGAWLYMAGETDAWQPAERTLGITRHVLELLSDHAFAFLLLSTRSTIIGRDIDVLQSMTHRTEIGVSIPTDLEDVRRIAEPTAPRIEDRFATVRLLRQAGLSVRINVAPLLKHTSEFAARLFDAAPWVWVDYPDPATPVAGSHAKMGVELPVLASGDACRDFHSIAANNYGTSRVGLGRDDFSGAFRRAREDAT